jgi:excisionase family DNA binding protein
MTTKSISYLNSEEAAKVLGVNVSTIKRWTDAGKLQCIQTSGGHRKFLMTHLSEFLEKNKKKSSKVNVFPIENKTDLDISYYILKGNYKNLIDYTNKKALRGDRNAVQKVLNGLYLGQYELYQIYDQLMTPVLHRIGSQWQKNQISIIEEHIASQTIRDALIRLQGIIHLPLKTGVPVLCLNLSKEFHDIALKMVQHILEVRGFQTYFSGQITPLLDIEQTFDKIKPQRLYISSTAVIDLEEFEKDTHKILDICSQYDTDSYIGGQGWDALDINHPALKQRLYTFEEVYKV